VPDKVAQLVRKVRRVSELLGKPCGANRDYLMIKKTKSVRIDIVSFADTTIVIGWD
jgi:predicted transcriptional regulator